MRLHKKISTAVIVGSTVLLSACGGGGGSGENPVRSFADLEKEFNALEEELLLLPYTDPSTLPTTGSSTYNGVLGVITDEDVLIGGQMRLNANFASNSINGDVRNIIDDSNNRYGGTLQITDGIIDRTANVDEDYTFAALIGGNLSQGGDNFAVDGAMIGDFVGVNHQGVEGLVFGTVTSSGGTSGLQGEFYGKR